MARRKKVVRDIPLSSIKDKEELILRLSRMYQFAVADKEPWEKEARRFYQAYEGEQLYSPDTGDPLRYDDWQVSTVRNHLFATINSFKATMTDNRPLIYAVARKPEDEELADDISQMLYAIWQIRNIDISVKSWIVDGLICGMGFLKTYWNVPQDDIGISVVRPFDIYIDPYADPTNPIKSAKYVIHKFSIDIEEIEALYPKKIDEILTKGEGEFEDDEIRGAPKSDYRKLPAEDYELRRFTGLEFWIRDESTIPITLDDSTIEEIAAFPKGRVITVIGNTIVRDDPNPFTHGRFPFVPFVDHYVSGQIWGMGEVKQLEQPQIFTNKILNQILSNSQLMTNSQWIIEEGVIKGLQKLNYKPGLIVEIARGRMGGIRKEAAMPLPPHIFQLLIDVENSIQTISGLTDYSTGKRPTSLVHTSGLAVASVQEAAQAPIRDKVRNMEIGLVELGMQLLGLIQQFYEPGKYISFVSNGQQAHIQFNQKHAETEFTIQVEAGSTLPVNKIDRANQVLNVYDRLIQLAQVGMIDPIGLTRWMLEEIDIPGTYTIINLLKQNQQMQQMQQNQQMPGMPSQGQGQGTAPGAVTSPVTPPLTQGGIPAGTGTPPNLTEGSGGQEVNPALQQILAQLGQQT